MKIFLVVLLIVTLLFLTSCMTTPEDENSKWGFWGFWSWWWNRPKPPIIPVPPVPPKPEPVKWSGLGMGLYWDDIDPYIDTLLDKGFTELRLDIPDYTNSAWITASKAAVIRAVNKGADVIWGVSSNPTIITSTSWPAFRQAILNAATWAQANGVYEFQIGNEEEWHVDGTTMTVAQIITNLKSVATDVQAIFTRGNVSYSSGNEANTWHSVGMGDVDLLAFNIYMGADGEYTDWWKSNIDNIVSRLGADKVYVTEFNPSSSSIDDYSTDEAVQAAGVTEMINYIKAKGITRAMFYCWKGDAFGVIKDNGTYRLLWDQALLNTGN